MPINVLYLLLFLQVGHLMTVLLLVILIILLVGYFLFYVFFLILVCFLDCCFFCSLLWVGMIWLALWSFFVKLGGVVEIFAFHFFKKLFYVIIMCMGIEITFLIFGIYWVKKLFFICWLYSVNICKIIRLFIFLCIFLIW